MCHPSNQHCIHISYSPGSVLCFCITYTPEEKKLLFHMNSVNIIVRNWLDFWQALFPRKRRSLLLLYILIVLREVVATIHCNFLNKFTCFLIIFGVKFMFQYVPNLFYLICPVYRPFLPLLAPFSMCWKHYTHNNPHLTGTKVDVLKCCLQGRYFPVFSPFPSHSSLYTWSNGPESFEIRSLANPNLLSEIKYNLTFRSQCIICKEKKLSLSKNKKIRNLF